MFDVIIVGAGPAGLSAALVLGRCRRRVLVVDSGKPRNAASRGLHGFLTRDGIDPLDFLKIAKEQLQQYDTVELHNSTVTQARKTDVAFEIELSEGDRFACRKLLLATGVVDELPEINGLDHFYGRSVFHCPYCDGWEMRDEPLAVYGRGENGSGLSLELLFWSKDIVLCTDGASELDQDDIERLHKHNIAIREQKIVKFEGKEGVLSHIVFVDGERLPRRGIFFSTGQHQHSELAKSLGCEFTDDGCVNTGDYETTNIRGLYVAGDASRLVQFVVVAAAEGAQAAVAINKELMKEDLGS